MLMISYLITFQKLLERIFYKDIEQPGLIMYIFYMNIILQHYKAEWGVLSRG